MSETECAASTVCEYVLAALIRPRLTAAQAHRYAAV
jgi:hypothetical protein